MAASQLYCCWCGKRMTRTGAYNNGGIIVKTYRANCKCNKKEEVLDIDGVVPFVKKTISERENEHD